MNKEKTLREHMSDAGKARWKDIPAEKRSEHARMAVQKRWAKQKELRTPLYGQEKGTQT